MTGNTLKLHGNRTSSQFVVSSFNAVLKDSRLHDSWWQADVLVDKINIRCQFGDTMKVKKLELTTSACGQGLPREVD